MGYYSDVEAAVRIDIDKVADMVATNPVTPKDNTATLADTIKSSVGVPVHEAHDTATKAMLRRIYIDWGEIFINSSFLRDTFNEFVKSGEIHADVYELKMYDLAQDLKNFVEKYGDVIMYIDAERSGEENGDIERFEVRNVGGKNTLFSAVAEMTFNYTLV